MLNQHGGESKQWTAGNLDIVRSPEPSDSLALWTKLGLACLFLAVATPMVGFGGLWIAALSLQLAAAGLDLSHARLPAITASPADWDLRLVYVAALSMLLLRAGVSRLPRPTRRVAGLGAWHWWLFLGGALWLASAAALVFERQMLDLADAVHLVVLGSTWLWTTATAMWLIASLGRAGVVLLAVAAQKSRFVGGSVALVGLASMVIVTPVLANPDELHLTDIRPEAPLLAMTLVEDVQAVDHSLRRLTAGGGSTKSALLPSGGAGTTPALPPAGGGSSGDDRYTTAQCMEELVKPPPAKLVSPVDEVIHNITRRVGNPDLAREIVHTKLIAICTEQPKRKGKLVNLLQRAATFGATDLHRDAHRFRWINASGLEDDDRRERCSSFSDGRPDEEGSFEELYHERVMIEAALKKLSSSDERLIRERYFEDLEYEDMATQWQSNEEAIARRTRRAVERLREQMQAACIQ
jgi:DNA-directed RNA polymerase specialized sigma24 family protein